MASGDIQVLSQNISVAPSQTRQNATYIGDLDDGYSMIDVNGSLSARDRGQYYNFRMTRAGLYRLSLTPAMPGSTDDDPKTPPDQAVRVQLMNSAGRVIADSDPTTGGKYAAYQKLTSDTNLQLSRGTYTVHIFRGSQGDSTQAYNYSLTMQAGGQTAITAIGGGFTNRDYDNLMQPAAPQSTSTIDTQSLVSAAASATLGLFDTSTNPGLGLFIDTLG
ncbi:MAG TPA: hypothetical protein VIE46_07115 [Gemmatimonadales bacterium]